MAPFENLMKESFYEVCICNACSFLFTKVLFRKLVAYAMLLVLFGVLCYTLHVLNSILFEVLFEFLAELVITIKSSLISCSVMNVEYSFFMEPSLIVVLALIIPFLGFSPASYELLSQLFEILDLSVVFFIFVSLFTFYCFPFVKPFKSTNLSPLE